ncbi:MAG TPA: MFS transporter [Bacteroidales bacterium]|nr:MAG: hypothetical protein A2W98_04405 [Bacteroidetes bacterium GWF2_33_38]OFY74401.1 MAG: hypothetical protein A2265_03710 [Bacteroidetes bacterium RIFOXYA12_FULL_33_9]HBF88994.1 MFS transporter [Bacteroidales bacterium]
MSKFNGFPRTFWIANVIELFERWAWYGMFIPLSLYLTNSTDTGALGFSQIEKGTIMGVVSAMLYLLPIITGAIADKFGYKKVLLISLMILSSGYYLLTFFTEYYSFFFAFLYLGIGAALFKPIIAATVAKTTNESNSSIGFGIFYQIVNIGAFIGPLFASELRETSWNYLFYASAIAILLNIVLTIFFYKEPERETDDLPFFKSIAKIFQNIWHVLKDFRFAIFLIIIIGFWTMYFQLFYTLPVFIEQWVDTRILYNSLNNISPSLAQIVGTEVGTVAADRIVNIDAGYIIIFQILVSTFVMKFKPINAMIAGIIVASIGLGVTFIFQNPFFLFLSILIFSLGEMASSPKITEYISKVAPNDKTALYIGTSYLPLAGGNLFAGIISGVVYSNMSDKISLLETELSSRNIVFQEISDSYTQNNFIQDSLIQLNMTEPELTSYLWNTYQPSNIWYVFTGIGLFTALALFLFNKYGIKKG